MWDTTWTGANVSDANFKLKIIAGDDYQIYKTFGFTVPAAAILTGIEVRVEAKWDGTVLYIDHIDVKCYYGTSVLSVAAGSQAYATDGRKAGEGAGAGTGVLVFNDGSKWAAVDTGLEVAA